MVGSTKTAICNRLGTKLQGADHVHKPCRVFNIVQAASYLVTYLRLIPSTPSIVKMVDLFSQVDIMVVNIDIKGSAIIFLVFY